MSGALLLELTCLAIPTQEVFHKKSKDILGCHNSKTEFIHRIINKTRKRGP
jgi:hypothetical protein